MCVVQKRKGVAELFLLTLFFLISGDWGRKMDYIRTVQIQRISHAIATLIIPICTFLTHKYIIGPLYDRIPKWIMRFLALFLKFVIAPLRIALSVSFDLAKYALTAMIVSYVVNETVYFLLSYYDRQYGLHNSRIVQYLWGLVASHFESWFHVVLSSWQHVPMIMESTRAVVEAAPGTIITFLQRMYRLGG